MDIDEISKNVEAFIEETSKGSEVVEDITEVETAAQPTDLWEERRRARANATPPAVHGANPHMQLDLQQLLAGPIKDAYKKTREDSERLRAEGEINRAYLLEQQYMEDYYYPVIDALIRLNSQEEVLASQDALEALDQLAIVPAGGDTTGYASVFISQLYQPIERVYKSDAQVREATRKIRALCNSGQIRQAGTVARRIQEKIDYGSNVATPEDYEMIQRIVLRTS